MRLMYRILPTLKSLLFAYIEIDNGVKLKTKLYNTLDDFTFPIVNFPFTSSNIPASPV
jgi:hypothetical protein